ncbi:MAG: hypothetical protein ALAOOOJD_01526 [bacterium]|nr:hypothetical protein [bacterium]
MKALLVVLILAALVIGFIYYAFPWVFRSTTFNSSALEKDFVASIPTIFRTPGGNLELAGFTATETFISSDTAKLPYLNINIPGATTTVIITVPVVYRYFVPLQEKWDITVADNNCSIIAPALRPTLPPAIQSDKMEIKTIEGPLAFDGKEQQAKLLQGITPQLEAYAQDSTKIKFVREEARQTVVEFVQTWLLQRGDWGQQKVEHLHVSFRGEAPENAEWQRLPVETPSVERQQ